MASATDDAAKREYVDRQKGRRYAGMVASGWWVRSASLRDVRNSDESGPRTSLVLPFSAWHCSREKRHRNDISIESVSRE